MPRKQLLQTMSVEEKMEVLELVWDDLCIKANRENTPDWHEGILNRREVALLAGKDPSIDWKVAKQRILEDLQ